MKTLESKAIPVFTYECMDRGFGLCNTPVGTRNSSKIPIAGYQLLQLRYSI